MSFYDFQFQAPPAELFRAGLHFVKQCRPNATTTRCRLNVKFLKPPDDPAVLGAEMRGCIGETDRLIVRESE